MSAPSLLADLPAITENARVLVDRLAGRGIAVTGVVKAALGSPEVGRAMLCGGVSGLGDSRVENLETLRSGGVRTPLTLIRTPMPSQAARVVRAADTSLNTEPAVVAALAEAAVDQRREHGVVLMVELSSLVEQVEHACGITLDVVSGGNSANLEWALGSGTAGRVNELQLGEAILLGVEPLHRTPVPGLRTDAFTLVAEVVEARRKPARPWGRTAQAAFGVAPAIGNTGEVNQVIVALGRQDADPDGLIPPPGIRVLAMSSDHLILDAGDHALRAGDELEFGLDYSCLLRAMTSPYVATALSRPRVPAPA